LTVPRRRSVRANAQLQNQENSGEAEMGLMRLEQEAFSARHEEERHGEVMDETPPRIGRMERFARD
jgi:protein involved in sex pheromone biosynthesis